MRVLTKQDRQDPAVHEWSYGHLLGPLYHSHSGLVGSPRFSPKWSVHDLFSIDSSCRAVGQNCVGNSFDSHEDWPNHPSHERRSLRGVSRCGFSKRPAHSLCNSVRGSAWKVMAVVSHVSRFHRVVWSYITRLPRECPGDPPRCRTDKFRQHLCVGPVLPRALLWRVPC